jgi:hypothetical protein
MAAASLLGLSLGVGVAHAADTGVPAADASDQIKHKGAADEAPRISGHFSKVTADLASRGSIQIKGDSTPADRSAHYEKRRNNRPATGQAEDQSSHYIKMDSSQMKRDSTGSASHQIKLKGQ